MEFVTAVLAGGYIAIQLVIIGLVTFILATGDDE